MKGKLLLTILSVVLVGVLLTSSCQSKVSIDGRISNINLPASVEGTGIFPISVEVQNTGTASCTFEVRLDVGYVSSDSFLFTVLEIVSQPDEKNIDPGEIAAFEFNLKACWIWQPEVSTSLNFEVYTNGQLVDTRSANLTVLMPQLKFTGYKVASSVEWFDRGMIINLTLEVKNKGRASAENVSVKATLYETDGTTRDISVGQIGYLASGASDRVDLVLDGDLLERYLISIEVRDTLGLHDAIDSEEFTLTPTIPWEDILPLLLYLLG